MRVATPPADRPLLVYDGDCGFCRFWVRRWSAATGGRVDYASAEAAAGRFPEIPAETFRRSVVLVDPDGAVATGADAVFRALAAAPGRGLPLFLYRRLPGAAPVSEAFYTLVAKNRGLFSRLTLALWGADPEPPAWGVSRVVFLRLLGIVYLLAFASLWVQLEGLAGERGILPAGEFLETLRARTGIERYWLAPTLAWLRPGDAVLHVLAGGGVLLSVLLAAGAPPLVPLVLLWASYLSLVTVSRVFCAFQWDGLLLETGLLAILLAPPGLRPVRAADPPPRAARLLLWWLAFRLMFSSGWVKLTSGDPSWPDLTALTFHYETQPLPPWTAWYAHQLPPAVHRATAFAMFAVEMFVPFAIFGPPRPRRTAFLALVLLQAAIAATGNYACFNLLTAVLLVPLVDDAAWPAAVRRRLAGSSPFRGRSGRARRAAAIVLFLLSSAQFAGTLGVPLERIHLATAVHRNTAAFFSVNRYGLFAVMTKERPEIVIEGSADGETWRPYEFRWKPGDVMRRPAFVAPHQPRLDWQMWFAALRGTAGDPWFFAFLERLLEGSPAVLGLLRSNPFPDAPPGTVRAVLYDYRFTTSAERARTGAWWRRDERGLYCPPIVLRQRM